MWGYWLAVAVCHLQNNDYAEAIEAALQAKQQSPNHPNVHSILTEAFEHLGQHQKAISSARAILRVCPGDPLGIDQMKRLAKKRGN